MVGAVLRFYCRTAPSIAWHDDLHAEIEDLGATIDDLETQVDRLQNEKQLILQQREEHTDLVKTVERQQSLAERKARAGLLTKTKWAIFGMKDD